MTSQHHTTNNLIMADDVDLLSGGLTGWNQRYDQLTSGVFKGQLQDIHRSGVRFFREITNTGLRQSGRISNDMIAMGIPINAIGRGNFCGMTSHHDALHVFSGADGFEFHTPSHLEIVGIAIPREVFARYDGIECATPFGRISRIIDLDPDVASGLRQHLCDGLDIFAASQNDMIVDQQLYQWLRSLSGHLTALAPDMDDTAELTSTRRREIFHEAIDYALLAGRDDKITIREICQMQGISRRSLQYAFVEFGMLPPEKYLKHLRLNQARRMIKERQSITSAALEWGFWHLGRFSAAYTDLFNERPSATAKRAISRN